MTVVLNILLWIAIGIANALLFVLRTDSERNQKIHNSRNDEEEE